LRPGPWHRACSCSSREIRRNRPLPTPPERTRGRAAKRRSCAAEPPPASKSLRGTIWDTMGKFGRQWNCRALAGQSCEEVRDKSLGNLRRTTIEWLIELVGRRARGFGCDPPPGLPNLGGAAMLKAAKGC
jgi:hypothetical protein